MRNAGSYDSLQRVLAEVPADEREVLKEAWELAGDAPAVDAGVKARSWQALAAMTAERPSVRLSPSVAPRQAAPVRMLRLVRTSVFRQYTAVAASLLLFVMAGYLTHPSQSVYRAGDAVASINLVDGTSVDLAPHTELRVSDGFAVSDRSVDLDGEAFFDVTPASESGDLPFRIGTFNSSVEVVGTAFNVRARESRFEYATQVAVEHGVVRVSGDDDEVRLTAGQGTRVATTVQAPQPVSVERATAWRFGGLAFDGVALGGVFEELERRFDLRIDATEAISRIEVNYWRETTIGIDQILADLADAVGAEIRPTANGFEVYQSERP
ncbi:MAG: FecR domain-containing protein [Rhodothermales bacterium]|nr:FecR domain-containing protein [Rhodothermales bacterium]MBO6781563.1 FecR domain-containing protein [Rhodothermales bacterium]